MEKEKNNLIYITIGAYLLTFIASIILKVNFIILLSVAIVGVAFTLVALNDEKILIISGVLISFLYYGLKNIYSLEGRSGHLDNPFMIIKDRDLFAEKGYVLTNGHTYGSSARLGAVDSAENWREITEAEYQEILKEQEENNEY